MNGIFTLTSRDAVKGFVVALLAAVFAWFMQVLNMPDFSFATIDWSELARVSLAAVVAYLIKNFLSDKEGKVLGAETILGVKQ